MLTGWIVVGAPERILTICTPGSMAGVILWPVVVVVSGVAVPPWFRVLVIVTRPAVAVVEADPPNAGDIDNCCCGC